MRFSSLGLVLSLVFLSIGCGDRGDLEAGIPKGAFDKPAPPLSDAQIQMKERLEKQGGRGPLTTRGSVGSGSYIDKMKGKFNGGSQ